MQIFKYPIIIFACNRLEYFESTIKSLVGQSIPFDRQSVYLYLDRDDSELDQNIVTSHVNIFTEYFPGANIHISPTNVGIGINKHIAEIKFFGTHGDDWVLFLEDDMVLGEFYLESLLLIMSAQSSDIHLVAQIAAYGKLSCKADMSKLSSDLMQMEHSWGYLQSKKYWEMAKYILNEYFQIFSLSGYNTRDVYKIANLYSRLGISWKFVDEPNSLTSQDNFRTALFLYLGGARVNTIISFAHYIGRIGKNFTSSDYKELGYYKNNISKERLAKVEGINKSLYFHSVASVANYLTSGHNSHLGDITDGIYDASVTEFNKIRLANLLETSDGTLIVGNGVESLLGHSISMDFFCDTVINSERIVDARFEFIIDDKESLEKLTHNSNFNLIADSRIVLLLFISDAIAISTLHPSLRFVDDSADIERIEKEVWDSFGSRQLRLYKIFTNMEVVHG